MHATYKVFERKAWIERKDALKVRDMLGCESDLEGLEVVVEVLHLTAADYGEDVWGLLHDVGDRHW